MSAAPLDPATQPARTATLAPGAGAEPQIGAERRGRRALPSTWPLHATQDAAPGSRPFAPLLAPTLRWLFDVTPSTTDASKA
jgi:hypothetical protein